MEATGGRTATAYFAPDMFQFLRELKRNNTRDWFLRNKNRYESTVRDPVLRFIADAGPGLKRLSRYFVADARPTGGSMMRIYRDIRFARDKSPYKTAVGIHFWHAQGKEGATPAFYLHLEPGRSSVGAGVWRPESRALARIRDAITRRPKDWARATSGRAFRSACGLAGESLTRPPRGYDPNHPFIEDIKRRDFAVSMPLSEAVVCGSGSMVTFLDALRVSAPFTKFLTEALGLPF